MQSSGDVRKIREAAAAPDAPQPTTLGDTGDRCCFASLSLALT